MDTISFDDFKKLDLRVAKVLSAERIEGSDKLLRLEIDLGEDSPSLEASVFTEASADKPEGQRKRQLVAGIGKVYLPESIVGKEIIVVVNLEPRVIMGLESQGMLLAAHGEGGVPVLLIPEKEVNPGTNIH